MGWWVGRKKTGPIGLERELLLSAPFSSATALLNGRREEMCLMVQIDAKDLPDVSDGRCVLPNLARH